ncbi:phosphatase PAP2 family protein [Parafrankia elaeagni]|uniref:phosphatase PAP2 family protein n=1 Tax=Parafrankia elaeagni TaxID=222534 RepID=UPI00037B8ADC|nr:phosphatase PAP2 family protein [Parafrankia elaeagni]
MRRTSKLRIPVGLVTVAAVLGVVLVAAGRLILDGFAGIDDADAAAARELAARRDGWLVDLTWAGTYLSDTYVVIVATAVIAAVTVWWTRQWWLPGGAILLTAGETAIYEVSNSLVDRPRPQVTRLDPGDPMASFPSGHTAAAVCLYGGLACILIGVARHRGRRIPMVSAAVTTPLVVIVPLVVAFCRSYRGMHYASDVVAGLFLGWCWLITVNHLVLSRAWPAREARAARAAPAAQAAAVPRPADPAPVTGTR